MENIFIPQEIPEKGTQLVLRKLNSDETRAIPNLLNIPESFSNTIESAIFVLDTLQQTVTLQGSTTQRGSKSYKHKPFIEANTTEINLPHLKQQYIIPVFFKDNERTIAHQEFIEIIQNCISKIFPHHSLEIPEIRVSHQIKGRIPEAIHKNAKDLLNHKKTIYYERMAFIIRIPSITEDIQGNFLGLIVGGVRAYNQENLYNRKSMANFKFFIGFQNLVCCNLYVNSDGYVEDMRVSSYQELQNSISLHNYWEKKDYISIYLKKENLQIPELIFNDSQFSTIAKDYYQDEGFCRDSAENINLWKIYNLFTQANKSSYRYISGKEYKCVKFY